MTQEYWAITIRSRRYLPVFLEAFEFKAAPTARNNIEAVGVSRKLFAPKARFL